jgi:VTC domain
MSTAAITDRPAPPVDDLERELKFVMAAARTDIAARLLSALCTPDARYPDADVWTIYYDSPGFESLDEKLNSDYLKTKIRLRWYAPPGGPGEGPVFLEAKQRVGNRRDKVRILLPMTAETLAARRLDDTTFERLPQRLAEKGIVLGPDWRPMLTLRYRRRRFVDAFTGTRLSLDSDINAVSVNQRHLFARNLGPLPITIVECKGRADVLPGHLRPLISLGLRKQSMSKYATLLLQLGRVIH